MEEGKIFTNTEREFTGVRKGSVISFTAEGQRRDEVYKPRVIEVDGGYTKMRLNTV